MKFACLVYVDGQIIGRQSQEQLRALADKSVEYDWDLRRRGHLILAQPLAAPETAMTIRVRNGALAISDGPFADTKEVLGGFFLIEARDIAEAKALAAESCMAEMGAIEVRPFLEQTHSETGAHRPPLTA